MFRGARRQTRLGFFNGPAGNFSQPTHIELQIYARWRAAGGRRLRAAYQKNPSSPLLPPYPGITEKPGEAESREKNPPLQGARDLVQITGHHQGDCTFLQAAEKEEWPEHNNARGPFDELSCSSRYKNSSQRFPRYGPKFSHTRFHKKKQKSLVITPWPSFF